MLSPSQHMIYVKLLFLLSKTLKNIILIKIKATLLQRAELKHDSKNPLLPQVSFGFKIQEPHRAED